MNRWAIRLVSTLCTAAMVATAFPFPVAAEPSVKKKTSAATAPKPTFGQTFVGDPRREERKGVRKRQKGNSERKGGWTGWSEFYRSF
jgi:hypothetical protein